MPNYNRTQLIGHLCKDIDVRYAASGVAWSRNSIAVNNNYTKKDGTRVEDVLFIDITGFGRQAELMGEYLHKGSCVFVEGELKLDKWEDNEGNPRSKHSITIGRIIFLDRKDDSNQQQSPSPVPEVNDDVEIVDNSDEVITEEGEDIPF